MKEKITFGLVGCGAASIHHIRAVSQVDDARFLGVYSADKHQCAAFAKEHNLDIYASYEEMLGDERIDAVTICTPSSSHALLAIQAMKAGKHVVVEKPVALTLSDCREIAAVAKEYNRKCEVICQLRFSLTNRAVKRAIDDGLLGKIVNAGCYMKYYRAPEYYSSSDWRGTLAHDGGGALMNQGIHGIDLMRYLLGSPETVSAVSRTLYHDIETEDCAAALLTYPGGGIGIIEGTTCVYPGYDRRFEICGTKGSIILQEDSILRWDVDAPCPISQGTRQTQGGSSDPNAISAAGHAAQYEDIIDAIKNDRPVQNGPEEAGESVGLILSIYEASKLEKQINFREFLKN